jgi:hypothetical protein
MRKEMVNDQWSMINGQYSMIWGEIFILKSPLTPLWQRGGIFPICKAILPVGRGHRVSENEKFGLRIADFAF